MSPDQEERRRSRSPFVLSFALLLLTAGGHGAQPSGSQADPSHAETSRAEEISADLVLNQVTLYPSPESEPIENAVIWVRDGKIERVSVGDPGELPAGIEQVEGRGRVVTAAFWNSHVHFTPPVWSDPVWMSKGDIADLLREMLTGFGFVSVVDTGADPQWIMRLQGAIEEGMPGPRILMAGGSFVGKEASPAYLDFKLPELSTVDEARGATRRALELGPDGLKIFTGSFAGPGQARHMELPVVREITSIVHGAGLWVIAHPQSLRGVELAVEGGVDILAHTAPDAGPWSAALVKAMVEKKIALVPTLKLWRYELERNQVPAPAIDRFERAGIEQLRDFAAAGGEVLFGTDVGYMADVDPRDEYRLMAAAGLSFRQILASLTTAPARRFGKGEGDGTVTPGQPADLVVLAGDPAQDVTAFARVDLTLRAGRVIASSGG